jgi:hypothetical protein
MKYSLIGGVFFSLSEGSVQGEVEDLSAQKKLPFSMLKKGV